MMCEALFLKNPMFLWSGGKVALLRFFGARVGNGVVIKPSVSIKHPWFLEIGDHCWIGEQCWIDNLAPVTLASHCCLSQGALLLTGNHNYSKTTFDFISQPIRMERGSWVGARAVVCPGVTLAEGAVLAAGAVATRDLEAWGVYQGNPAVRVKERVVSEEGRRYGGT
jgi:putative colanic acid biosynthesis acetyltransferase WcaF